MNRRIVATALLSVFAAAPILAQKPAGAKKTVYDLTINADGDAYTGTMELVVAAGKVTGTMHITQPTEITGAAAGTSKAGQMKLDFPYRMVRRACDGRIAMDIKMAAKPVGAPATGTVSITECGRTEGAKLLPGTIELKPQVAPKKK